MASSENIISIRAPAQPSVFRYSSALIKYADFVCGMGVDPLDTLRTAVGFC